MDATAAQFRDDGPAIFFRQHDVDHQEIVARSPREVRARLAVPCDLHGIAGFLQALGQKGRGLVFVFDQQNSHLE